MINKCRNHFTHNQIISKKFFQIMETNSRKAIGERLLRIRTELNLSQEAFGELLAGKDGQGKPRKAIDRATISKYEIGTMDISKGAMLELVSSMGVNKEWLLHGKGEMFAPNREKGDIAKNIQETPYYHSKTSPLMLLSKWMGRLIDPKAEDLQEASDTMKHVERLAAIAEDYKNKYEALLKEFEIYKNKYPSK